MPKLALSRRHRRHNNLVQCWNSPASTASDDGSSEKGGIVRASARMVSDEDMHQSSASYPSSPEQSSPTTPAWCGERGSGRTAQHLQNPNQEKHSLKRPSPSMCLTELALASFSASSSSPRQHPKRPTTLEAAKWSSGFPAAPLSPSSSPSAPSSPKSDPYPASPCSPWGHFVDFVPLEQEMTPIMECDTGEASVSSTCGRGAATHHPPPSASATSRRLSSSPRAHSFLPGCPRPNGASGRCCENESPYESAFLKRQRIRSGRPTSPPAGAPGSRRGGGARVNDPAGSPTAAGSVSFESLSGFVLGFPSIYSSPSRSAGKSFRGLDLNPKDDNDLKLLMEDARAQFGELTMKH